MYLLAHKLMASIVLVGLFLASTVCPCAGDEQVTSASNAMSAPDLCGDEHGGDHDQDHPDHGTCQCITDFVYVTDHAPAPDLQPVMLLASFSDLPPQSVLFRLQFLGRGISTFTIYPPSAVTTLLRLHCALMV